MTNTQWEELLKKTPEDLELWRAYAWWLQDENDQEDLANKISVVLDHNYAPRWRSEHHAWEWHCTNACQFHILPNELMEKLFLIVKCPEYNGNWVECETIDIAFKSIYLALLM